MSALSFTIDHQDASSRARTGRVVTRHGEFQTPAFMPVGTQGAVKGILPHLLRATGAQIILANTYHLMLRPGSELVRQMGGLQQWTRWQGPMLTDSGGYQVFSLAQINKINDHGVTFQSHIDGATVELTPARSMQVQNDLGADIIMAFDDCPPPEVDIRNSYADRVKLANERTLRWLAECVTSHARKDEQSLFGIVQGGIDLEQRSWCAGRVCEFDLPGYAIGGVSVGEPPEEVAKVVEHTAALLPVEKPRYLMGVGYERDIVAAVRSGVDMFDCVLPTRNGRNGAAFTRTGQIRLKNAKFRDDPRPIEEGCDCPACAEESGIGYRESSDVGYRVSGIGSEEDASPLWPSPETRYPIPDTRSDTRSCFSRSYLRHLFLAGEMLGPILVSLHNLRHFQRLLLDIRTAIRSNGWSLFARQWPVAFTQPQTSPEDDHVD
ncbi:MAG: tRNA guanosine(34) transglycosylase Tgt [Phycisphaeraceae bacterium]|nr:tRNA guanosine(34) transglycosylase Tgt [Phycisphaeraceae bacterium]